MSNKPVTPRNVPFPEYLSIMRERVDQAKPKYFFVPTHDIRPVELHPGIYASLDGIVTRGSATIHTYPFQDPGSRFLEKALTNHGYVARAHHFGNGVHNPQGLERFIEAFNENMKGLLAIYAVTDPRGYLLVRAPAEGAEYTDDTLTSDLSLRVSVSAETKGHLDALRKTSEHLRTLRNGESNA